MNLSTLLLRWRGVDPKRRRAGQGGAGRFTQAEAADKLHTHLKTYQDWEQGRKQPRGAALAYVLQSLETKNAGGGVSRETKKNTAQRAATRASRKEKPHARKKRKRAVR